MGAMGSPAGDARAAAIRAFHDARAAGDVRELAEIALALPSGVGFGTDPGQIPALVHEVYMAVTEPALRCRLAAALARAWVYGGDAARARPFAAEAVDLADQLPDRTGNAHREILACALDAALLAHWGPGDFAERIQLAARLADTTAHLSDAEARLSALLWRLTTAWECLDLLAVQRQLRALDVLAAESGSGRVAFFAAARRAAYALVSGELAEADDLIARTRELGSGTAEPDVAAVTHSLAASRARRAGDTSALHSEAAAFEAFGAEQGIGSVVAEAAVLWLDAGERGRAARLLHRIAGPGLGTVPRDVDYLLTLACVVDVAVATGAAELAREGAALIEPYAGRAILNAGAVSFHGVTDDYLHRAHEALGSADARRWRDSATLAYQRIGAPWWLGRLRATGGTPTPSAITAHLRQNADHTWIAGRDTPATLPDLKGLHHLRHLLGRPGVDIAAGDLAAAANGHPGEITADPGGGDLLDPRALAAYRARLAAIDGELADADARADQPRSADLTGERDFVLREIRAATGLGGRARQFSSAHERARVAVRKAIAVALERIGDHDPALGRLLRDTVHTGSACRYDPDPDRPVAWQLGTGPAGITVR
ncbi:MAG: hypothetical protein QOI35_974 [Cryptosporangiaceae bacterium]|nr:hypothetical protein [Cryptosporangiaceae bacterium]